MKSVALFAAMFAVSTAQFGGFTNPAVADASVFAVKGPLQNVLLVKKELSLPKCFPNCL